MNETDLIHVEIPASLWSTLDICFRHEGVTAEVATMRLIDALPGLSKPDLDELQEPRRERLKRDLALKIGNRRRTLIEQVSRTCGASSSSIIRRLLYAFFVSKELAFLGTRDGTGIRLQRTQQRFDFCEQYERDSEGK
jgi:hypothetical protein